MDWGSLAMAAGNTVGTIATGIVNNGIQKATRNWQSEENKLNRNWQSGENAASRSFTAYENKLSREWQERMWNLENQYNTPSAMMERYREAGLNPYLNAMVGQGAGAAGPAGTPATSSSAPMGSPSMVGSPSVIPFGDLGSGFTNALGVSANIANQSAKTLQTKWQIYNSILENGDRETAKRFLNANPDMMSDADPENSIYYKRWQVDNVYRQLQYNRDNFEFDLRRLTGVSQVEATIRQLNAVSDDLYSQISKRDVDINEVKARIKHITEQIKTEKSVRARNYSEADLASARAQTEKESREYVVSKLLSESRILDRADIRDAAVFESDQSMLNWMASPEGQQAKKEAARIHGSRRADAIWTAIMDLLGSVSVGTGVNYSNK